MPNITVQLNAMPHRMSAAEKRVPNRYGPDSQLLDDRPHHEVVAAIGAHGAGAGFPLHGPVHHGRLERGRVVDHPAQIGSPQRIVHRGRETGRREAVGQVKEDRDLFGHQGLAIEDRRDLADRVHCEESGAEMLAGPHVEHVSA